MIEIYTDGATVGHNGKLGTVKEVGLGMWVSELEYGDSKKVQGISNNEAEFKALIWAMEWAINEEIEEACFKMDSQIVTNRANGSKPKSRKHANYRMDAFQDRVLELKKKFDKVYFKWIPREQNEKADYYSKEATKMDLEIENEYSKERLA
jgi:ribonuclease HI